jgi:hypothetical protein
MSTEKLEATKNMHMKTIPTILAAGLCLRGAAALAVAAVAVRPRLCRCFAHSTCQLESAGPKLPSSPIWRTKGFGGKFTNSLQNSRTFERIVSLMTKLPTLILALIVAIVPSVYAEAVPPKPQAHFGREAADWKKEPFEFLAFLIRQHERGAVMVTLGNAPKDWIKKEHIGLLVLLMDSKEPCAAVYPGRSSEVFPGSKGAKPSIVGHEAAYLIASYRHGLFPMSGTLASCHLDFDRQEIRRWWTEASKP